MIDPADRAATVSDDRDWRSLVTLRSTTEERNERTLDLDTLEPAALVSAILDEDARVASAVQARAAQLGELAQICVDAIAAGGTVHYVGAGTSGRLGVLDAVELVPTYSATPDMVTAHLAGGDTAMMRAVEGAEDDASEGARVIREECGARDVVIGLAASGRTPFVRGALEAARESGLPTALIAANPHAPLAALADVAVLLEVGPEVVTGSTRMKAATAQKMALNALSTAVMVRLGKTYSNLMIDVRPTNAKLVARTVRMLVQASGADADRAAAVLEESGRSVRIALIALLADAPVEAARGAADAFPPDPRRAGDPAGIRSALLSLGEGR